jgi:hypothetical protein
MNLIMYYLKPVAAFVAGVAGNMIVNLINGVDPWPQTTGQWLQFAVTSFGAAIAAWIAPNKITDKQIAKDPSVVRVIPPVQPAPPAGGYRNPWS